MTKNGSIQKVLVVDDMEASRFLVESFLKNENLELHLAASGDEALSLVAQTPFDLIFLDIVMPEKDGFQTAKEIRDLEAIQKRNSTKIFALSANDSPGDIQDCLSLGFDGHLSKPISRKSLLKVIEENSSFKSRSSLSA